LKYSYLHFEHKKQLRSYTEERTYPELHLP